MKLYFFVSDTRFSDVPLFQIHRNITFFTVFHTSSQVDGSWMFKWKIIWQDQTCGPFWMKNSVRYGLQYWPPLFPNTRSKTLQNTTFSHLIHLTLPFSCSSWQFWHRHTPQWNQMDTVAFYFFHFHLFFSAPHGLNTRMIQKTTTSDAPHRHTHFQLTGVIKQIFTVKIHSYI